MLAQVRRAHQTVSAATLAPLLRQAEHRGIDRATLLAAVGIADPADSARVPYDRVTALWNEAARRSADAAFGVHAAVRAGEGVFDVVEYAALSSPTLAEALHQLCRYQRIVTEVATFTLHGSVLRLGYNLSPEAPPPSRHASEYLLACVLHKARQATQRPLARVVRFRHAAPADATEQQRFFACRLAFAQPFDQIEFDTGALQSELVRADPALRAILDRHARTLLSQIPDDDRLTTRLHRWLVANLTQESVGRAAAHLGLSERSLQRRLHDEGETFASVLDRARRGEAMRLLGDQRLAIAEIAFLLGFSEASAFHRAFKRWTGTTPSAHRATRSS